MLGTALGAQNGTVGEELGNPLPVTCDKVNIDSRVWLMVQSDKETKKGVCEVYGGDRDLR